MRAYVRVCLAGSGRCYLKCTVQFRGFSSKKEDTSGRFILRIVRSKHFKWRTAMGCKSSVGFKELGEVL